MSSSKLFVAVKACIVNDQEEVLLVRESSNYIDGTNTAKYDVVGGRIEPSEMLLDALKREVKEETGLIVEDQQLIDVHDTFNHKHDEIWHIVRLYYKVTCAEGEIVLSKDHDEYTWVSLREVQQFPGLIDNLIPTLKKII